MELIFKSINNCYLLYCIFSIKCPLCLFQTWPGGPGVYLKPAFIWSRRLIGAQCLLTRCFFFLPFYQVDLSSPNVQGPGKVGQDGMIFPFIQSDKLSLDLLRVTVTIQHAYYCMLQWRCVKKKNINNTCTTSWGKLTQSFKFISKHHNARKKVRQ